jgi:hypothetical protein
MHAATLVGSYSRRQQFRRMALTLLAEKDNTLADLGYKRWEINVALKLPLRTDAMAFLEQHRRASGLENDNESLRFMKAGKRPSGVYQYA